MLPEYDCCLLVQITVEPVFFSNPTSAGDYFQRSYIGYEYFSVKKKRYLKVSKHYVLIGLTRLMECSLSKAFRLFKHFFKFTYLLYLLKKHGDNLTPHTNMEVNIGPTRYTLKAIYCSVLIIF